MADPKVVREIKRQGRGRPRRLVRAALATGIVESGLENLPGGDKDSVNWRQERASIYGGDMSIRRSVARFYKEAEQLDRGQPAGQLAADVQRPAAQYRGRYSEVIRQQKVKPFLKGFNGGGGGGGGGGGAKSVDFKPWALKRGTATTFDDKGFEEARKRALVGSMIAARRGTGSILFRSGLLSTQAPSPADFTRTERTSKLVPGRVTVRDGGGGGGALGSGQAADVIREARRRLGASESSGSNRGPKIDKWQAQFGMVGQPWCGIYVGVNLKAAGVRGITPSIASVAATIADARAGRNGFEAYLPARKAQPGDVFTIGSGTHMGLIEKVNRNGTVTTLEGNTSNGTARRNTRRLGEFSGVARPRYRRR